MLKVGLVGAFKSILFKGALLGRRVRFYRMSFFSIIKSKLWIKAAIDTFILIDFLFRGLLPRNFSNNRGLFFLILRLPKRLPR